MLSSTSDTETVHAAHRELYIWSSFLLTVRLTTIQVQLIKEVAAGAREYAPGFGGGRCWPVTIDVGRIKMHV